MIDRRAGRALVALAATVVAATACGALPFRSPVPDLVLDAATTAGAVCWAQGAQRSTAALASATYRATAVFDPGALAVGDALDVVLYVRTVAPDAPCTLPDGAVDAPIADPFTLQAGVATPVVAGDGAYGAVLADAAHAPAYWIGASTSGSVALTGDATVRLADGVVEARLF